MSLLQSFFHDSLHNTCIFQLNSSQVLYGARCILSLIHHKEDETSYVLEGEIMAQIGDQLIQAPAGTLIFKPRGLPHTFWNQGPAPARILEIISPAGFEKYFEELAELFAPGGPPDIPRLLTLTQKYDLELDMSSVMELSQKYHVSLGRAGQPT